MSRQKDYSTKTRCNWHFEPYYRYAEEGGIRKGIAGNAGDVSDCFEASKLSEVTCKGEYDIQSKSRFSFNHHALSYSSTAHETLGIIANRVSSYFT